MPDRPVTPRHIGDVLNKLAHVHKMADGFQADCPCPGHDTPKKHLSIKDAGDKALVTCFGSHTYKDICKALGYDSLTYSKAPTPIPSEIVATYDYLDEQKNLLFQVVRYRPKDFKQRHKNGSGQWVWNLDGVRRVLYHLPELVEPTNKDVMIVEGEKDADNLIKRAYLATTSPCGASAWRPEYADYLKGKNVTIIPDKDGLGFGYARQVAKSLRGKAKEIKAIILPGDGVKDVSDWLEAGGDSSTLPSLAQDAGVLFVKESVAYQSENEVIWWEKLVGNQILRLQAEKISEERTGIHARVTILMDTPLSWSYLNIERREDRSSLATAAHSSIPDGIGKEYGKDDLRRDLDLFCAGLWEYKMSLQVPELMAGDETCLPLSFLLRPYLLEGGGTILYAPPGRGKSFTALLWAVSVDAGCGKFWPVKQTPMLFINLERSRESVRRRLSAVNRVLGLPATRPLLTLNARGKSLADVSATCRKTIRERGVGFVVLDSISRAGVGDLTENLSGNRVIDALSGLCSSWLALGHTPRQSEQHLYGSVMQDAGADICVQLSSQTTDEGTLGVGWELTKQNDTGKRGQEIVAFEFNDNGLQDCRKAKPFEFPEIEGKAPQSMEHAITDFILEQEGADATATQIAEATGFNRSNVSHFLNESGKFVETRKIKTSVYYGVKEQRGDPFPP